MLNKMATLLHLQLKKGSKLHVFWQLFVNFWLRLKLYLYKKTKGINHPIVHYYAVCWNEEKILPFVFDYYKDVVDHFFIYDNYSNDKTIDIVKEQKNASLFTFGKEGEFDDGANREIKNNCWKNSRGKADYVIVCDVDEFVYAPNLSECLKTMKKERVSFPDIEGYEMYSDTFPEYRPGVLITELVRQGVHSLWLDKRVLFDPHRIVEVDYSVGSHQSYPVGVVRNGKDTLKLLHYKHLGADYLIRRYEVLGKRLSAYNRENDYGTHYLAQRQKILDDMQQGLATAKNVIA